MSERLTGVNPLNDPSPEDAAGGETDARAKGAIGLMKDLIAATDGDVVFETYWPGSGDDLYMWIDLIECLSHERDEAVRDASQMAATQCLFDGGKGVTGDDHGNSYCAMERRALAAESQLAAAREALTEIKAALVLEDAVMGPTPHRGRLERVWNIADQAIRALTAQPIPGSAKP